MNLLYFASLACLVIAILVACGLVLVGTPALAWLAGAVLAWRLEPFAAGYAVPRSVPPPPP